MRHKESMAFASINTELIDIVQRMSMLPTAVLTGEVKALYDLTLDHNVRKCKGKHCRECSIQPSFRHMIKESVRFLKEDVADAEAAVEEEVPLHTVTGNIPCTEDEHCMLCRTLGNKYSMGETVKNELSSNHVLKVTLEKKDPNRGQFRKEADRQYLSGGHITRWKGTPKQDGQP